MRYLRNSRLSALALALCAVICAVAQGLRMPEIYGDGMVLQRGRPLRISGEAAPGAEVGVEIGGNVATVLADAQGRWQAVLPPLASGHPYQLVVSDGVDRLVYNDVLAGEVWLASGQSNMEFILKNALGAQPDIAQASDPELRLYNMKPVALTNAKPWDAEAIGLTNEYKYYKQAAWESAAPGNVGDFSAVAYYFAKELRDSLDVPVGIICNAIGGSPAEAWIDAAVMQERMPGILRDWRANAYLMPWVQQRAGQNTPADDHHPYEPGYLFKAGVEPLGGYGVAGVIWYQGESNAHNVELHERLFPMLVDSWRHELDDPRMPFLFAQLSSIDRPEWPQFRDSQRCLAQEIPGTGMAVTFDHGDSLDVHPVNKKPVGGRLARIALHDVYGRQLECSGPKPAHALAVDGRMVLTMSHAQGMHAVGGGEVVGFEVAGADGIFHEAHAEIIGNQIILKNMKVQTPKYVRYGWQPFSRANLVNSAGLPASTFRIEADPDAPLGAECEPGYEKGVSACAAGYAGGMAVMAGGCNFPVDPLGKDSKKEFYKGVYAACPGDMQWSRIGELRKPLAYCAYANVGDGIAIIGGIQPDGAVADAALATVIDGQVYILDLPSFPGTIDNAYTCSIGKKVYVAGGNYNGEPSNQLHMLDLAKMGRGWERLPDMPGNPRVQPVMAAAKNADGEDCLWLWGGFAGKGPEREATLEVDGLLYTPSTGEWSALPDPVDVDGQAVSLGGGVACALADGRIMAAGGVNKDVFLAALRNQPAGYLEHPIEWYRFNQHLLVFDPKTGAWSVADTDPEYARAGAAVAASPSAIFLLGGELKPRIRTASVAVIDPNRLDAE